MGDPRHRKANFDYGLQRKRNYGVTEHGQDRSVDDESKRRLLDSESVSVASAPVRTVTQAQPTASFPPTAPKAGPDRVHKYGKYYVLVSADHDTVEDPVPNPMYAPSGLASTIADGYALAKTLADAITDTNARVALVVYGGAYNESLQLDHSAVDLYGEGRPVIVGKVEVMPDAMRLSIEGFELYNTGANLALWVHAGIDPTWTATTTGAIGPYYDAPIRVRDCPIHAEQQAVNIQRRCYFSHCDFWSDTSGEITALVSTIQVVGAASDRGNTIFSHCRMWSYSPFDETAGLKPNWYALTATSKAGAYQPTNGGYLLPAEQYHNGVALDHCDVFGSVSVAAWKLSCQHTTFHSGVQTPEFGGTLAMVLSGWYIWDPVEGYLNTISAQVALDNCIIDATQIARFDSDPHQSNPFVWGGELYIRNSMHLNRAGIGQPGAPYFNNASTGSIDVVDSATSALSWLTAGFAITVTNSPANINRPMLSFYLR